VLMARFEPAVLSVKASLYWQMDSIFMSKVSTLQSNVQYSRVISGLLLLTNHSFMCLLTAYVNRRLSPGCLILQSKFNF